jgi:hypothetical protein
MNRTEVALKYAKSLYIPAGRFGSSLNQTHAMCFAAELMKLGFMPSKKLVVALETLTCAVLARLLSETVAVLKKLKGDHVEHKPFYPDFPVQVMEMSHAQLFANAIWHYWTCGQWRPGYEKLPREYHFENVEFKEIGLIDKEDEFNRIFTRLLTSNESLSDGDKKTIEWFIDEVKVLGATDIDAIDIPYKENLCYVAGLLLERGGDIIPVVKTATDVLRIATHLSGGDISLGSNTKFKSLKRSLRRKLVTALEGVIREEDIARHRNKWVRLFHNLHVGEFSSKVYQIAKKVRENQRIVTFNSRVEDAITWYAFDKVITLLKQRPGEFARRLNHLLSTFHRKMEIVDAFLLVAKDIPTRVLLQLYGSLKVRDADMEKRIVFPKGNTQRAQIICGLPAMDKDALNSLRIGIMSILRARFSELDALGTVYIDPALCNCPLPTQQRSASEGLLQVARGTPLPIAGDKGTLRFFIYWKGIDIDLSATVHDENFEYLYHLSYTNLKSQTYKACHSGDIVSAPHGASEFIDITIDPALQNGVRYVAMNVFVYNGPTFAEHEECFVGWMTRTKPNKNAIFDPKTVEQKVDLRSNSKNCIPVVFDLKERRAIWTDVTTCRNIGRGGNNVESNLASIKDVLEAVTSLDNKATLYELFKLHAEVRGDLVINREEAQTVFSMTDGITPFDISIINSEYVV